MEEQIAILREVLAKAAIQRHKHPTFLRRWGGFLKVDL